MYSFFIVRKSILIIFIYLWLLIMFLVLERYKDNLSGMGVFLLFWDTLSFTSCMKFVIFGGSR